MKHLLAIESSCDDTSVAVIRLDDGRILSNVTASQAVHEAYGGVVPELASRAHEANILPTLHAALTRAGIGLADLAAVAATLGPGLMGSLLVGVNVAKALCVALSVPFISVQHLQGHALAPFVEQQPPFPYLCLLVSGGNSQILLVRDFDQFEILGRTIDDAAGEAMDKCAKVMGLGYPGGPLIDRLARKGNADAFTFARPAIAGLDYSFSGLKTSFLYFLRDRLATEPDFIETHKEDLAASLERTIVEILMHKLQKAVRQTGIREVALSGGVSANTALRQAFQQKAESGEWRVHIPPFAFTTDNAAMIANVARYKYFKNDFSPLSAAPHAR